MTFEESRPPPTTLLIMTEKLLYLNTSTNNVNYFLFITEQILYLYIMLIFRLNDLYKTHQTLSQCLPVGYSQNILY